MCEPAMGSAALLNEAVNQPAERYLERKQRELNRLIEHAAYADELQRARHRIADRNVFGVDLNPLALELAEVSLWHPQPRRVQQRHSHGQAETGQPEAGDGMLVRPVVLARGCRQTNLAHSPKGSIYYLCGAAQQRLDRLRRGLLNVIFNSVLDSVDN